MLEDADRAAEELLYPEFEHYIERKFDDEIPKILQAHNLLGLPISEEYGGRGADSLTYFLAVERLGQVGMGVVTFIDVHTSLAGLTIQQWGTANQKERYLAPSTKGKKILAYALTEVDAGSNPAEMKTSFEKENGYYVLNGSKYLISNGSIADALIVFARPTDKADGVTAFLVDADTEGFTVSMELKEKIGLVTSDTALLEFSECQIPDENVLGPPGKGFAVAYSALVNGRLGIAAGCLGVLDDILNQVVERARDREQHGKKIGKHQLIQKKIARIAANHEMTRWPGYIAAMLKDKYDKTPSDLQLRTALDLRSAIAKKLASEKAWESADEAVQIFGGFGYSLLSSVARHFADVRVARIYEGTDEIMELKIASSILGENFEAYS